MAAHSSAILIAGPTASGKSALAIEKARGTGGFIVNADSMQVYDVLNVLTARPSAVSVTSTRPVKKDIGSRVARKITITSNFR